VSGGRTYKHLCSRVVHIERLEDGRAVVGDDHLVPAAHALQDFVLRKALLFKAAVLDSEVS